jgi:hypothetical protein
MFDFIFFLGAAAVETPLTVPSDKFGNLHAVGKVFPSCDRKASFILHENQFEMLVSGVWICS